MGRKNIGRLPALHIILLLAVMMGAAAEAKEGFYLGAEMVFVDMSGTVSSGDAISSGDGAGIIAGYGISRNIAIEASYRSTKHVVTGGRKVDLTAALVGVKASLQLEESHIEPYLALGIGKYALDTRRGNGWRCGAGMDIRLTPEFSLSMGVSRHFIDFDPDPTDSGDVTSMEIGIAYHFQ